jgi:large subunit ribosomal protein L22
MKAYLRSVRIAPKKANIIAKMVRGMPVGDAMSLLGKTNKKGARIVEKLLASAVANARHNDKQHPSDLVIKTIVVNQSMGLSRGVPMARGRIRAMTKFMSHIDLALGIADGKMETTTKSPKAPKSPKKATESTAKASQKTSAPVKESSPQSNSKDSTSSSESSDSSVSSAS